VIRSLPRLLCSLALVSAFALTACSSAAAPPVATPDPPAPTATINPPQGHVGHGSASGDSGQVVLWAVQSGPLGVVATDGAGRLIYRSDNDSANPPTSSCTGGCAETWHPLVVTSGQQPELNGIDKARVGTLTRPDATVQLTLGGWPLYLNRDDDGQLASTGANGADGTWFAVTPTGDKASGK